MPPLAIDYLEYPGMGTVMTATIFRVYTAPGLSYHIPISESVTYIIGGSLAFGYSNVHRFINHNDPFKYPYKEDAYTAVTWDNDIMIQPSGHYIMGIHTAMGVSFAPITDLPFCFSVGLKFGRRY